VRDCGVVAGGSAGGRVVIRRVALVVAGVVVLCLVAGVVFLVVGGREPGVPVAGAAAAGGSGQAHEVAVALGRLVTDPESLVASSSRDQVGGRARQGVPAGSTVEVDEASWAPDGVGGGVVLVTVGSPGMSPVTFAAVMVLEVGQWKVVETVPVEDAAGGAEASPTGPTR